MFVQRSRRHLASFSNTANEKQFIQRFSSFSTLQNCKITPPKNSLSQIAWAKVNSPAKVPEGESYTHGASPNYIRTYIHNAASASNECIQLLQFFTSMVHITRVSRVCRLFNTLKRYARSPFRNWTATIAFDVVYRWVVTFKMPMHSNSTAYIDACTKTTQT